MIACFGTRIRKARASTLSKRYVELSFCLSVKEFPLSLFEKEFLFPLVRNRFTSRARGFVFRGTWVTV